MSFRNKSPGYGIWEGFRVCWFGREALLRAGQVLEVGMVQERRSVASRVLVALRSVAWNSVLLFRIALGQVSSIFQVSVVTRM